MGATGRAPVCISVDVEEWFHCPGHPLQENRAGWDSLPSSLAGDTASALDLLDETGSKGTFFVLGWAAKRYPGLVREIAGRGHEVACHGMAHRLVHEMTRDEFLRDSGEAKALLEECLGAEVSGYRAPRWSLAGVPWAYEALAELGFTYSSSRLPIPGLGGGAAGAARIGGVLELPALTHRWGGIRLPAGGTLALRALPFGFLEEARDEATKSGTPAVYWFHPWELSAAPRVLPGARWPFRLLRYGKLKALPGRLRRLAAGAVPLREASAVYSLR